MAGTRGELVCDMGLALSVIIMWLGRSEGSMCGDLRKALLVLFARESIGPNLLCRLVSSWCWKSPDADAGGEEVGLSLSARISFACA